MKTTKNSVLFWGENDIYSNWHPASFTVDGQEYAHVEQFMMAEKARLFKDLESLVKILATKSPSRAKSLGRSVKGYSDEVWFQHREQIVFNGCLAKFEQNPSLGEALSNTGNRVLIEASPTDLVWGIGLRETNPHAECRHHWKGLNLLGIALMRVREVLHCRIVARLNARPSLEVLTAPASVIAAPYRPSAESAHQMGMHGSAHSETERQLFEQYMKGHCWAVGAWLKDKQCYEDMQSRVLFAVWLDRGALSFGPLNPV